MHTPGPWDRSGDLIIGRFIEGRRNWTHIAAVDGDTDAEREANAQLIAAAPEMLQSLLEIVNLFSTGVDPRLDAALASAREVTARVMGRQGGTDAAP